MTKKNTTKKTVPNNNKEGMDKKALTQKNQEIQDIYSEISKAHEKLMFKFIEIARVLRIEGIKVGSKQEYDDNNYFRQNFLDSIFDEKDMELDSYDIEEGLPIVAQYVSEMKLPNSLDYMESSMTIEDYITRNPAEAFEELEGEFEYSHSVLDIAKACFKNGIKADELCYVKNFLVEVIQAPEQSLPAEWE
jgi:hypothetical protein